ncbi:MAG: hypothetical protein KJ970_04915 [Candidatus Eisenbacteria bacterium]|uniref:Uncharacterized protein n=1 Tax=Eiseniibacteriota bacterium TaxID=2212470 RepID=A0A948W5C0_UNCEI|nr:hypothetical protein [Candidatus Eisenbacteria bacterium]MBU1947336.1 hypothetical protein [Candidatus Eisenbacteria bacterium]MBU2690249.1 hypothetical protein [Candidatus Eisenbacteria bacterium]
MTEKDSQCRRKEIACHSRKLRDMANAEGFEKSKDRIIEFLKKAEVESKQAILQGEYSIADKWEEERTTWALRVRHFVETASYKFRSISIGRRSHGHKPTLFRLIINFSIYDTRCLFRKLRNIGEIILLEELKIMAVSRNMEEMERYGLRPIGPQTCQWINCLPGETFRDEFRETWSHDIRSNVTIKNKYPEEIAYRMTIPDIKTSRGIGIFYARPLVGTLNISSFVQKTGKYNEIITPAQRIRADRHEGLALDCIVATIGYD